MNSMSPPTGTLISVQVVGSFGLLHALTGLCGPAPLIGNPRSESAPPVKKLSLNGPSSLQTGPPNPTPRGSPRSATAGREYKTSFVQETSQSSRWIQTLSV